MYKKCAVEEKFWVKELNKFNASKLPFQPLLDKTYSKTYKKILAYKFSTPKLQKLEHELTVDTENTIFSMLLLYIHKFSQTNKISIKLKHINIGLSNPFNILFSEYVPFNISLDENSSFIEFIKYILKKKNSLMSKVIFENDIFFRYPNVSTNFTNQQSISILITDLKKNSLKYAQGNIVVIINKRMGSITWVHKK